MVTGPKVTRREFKEDKVYLTMAGVVDFVVRHRLWIGLAALAGIGVFALGYFMHLRSSDLAAEASWALYQTTFTEETSEKIAELEQVVADYASTPAGRYAAYLVANTLYEDGKYEEAIKAFQAFLKKNPSHLLAPSAIEAIGFSEESLGQWNEAITTYRELIEKRPESPAAVRAYYRIGLCYERSGQDEKAIEAYGTTLELLPNSLWAQYASERLKTLEPTIPTLPDAAALETLMQEAGE
jgi:tetratricopeptide (TPR) repeat protein